MSTIASKLANLCLLEEFKMAVLHRYLGSCISTRARQ